MRFKKVVSILALVLMGIGLMGCSAESSGSDVRVVNQRLNFDGLTQLLLNIATDANTIASMELPLNEQYEISLIIENYEQGELISSETVLSVTTGTLTNDARIYFILFAGDGENESRFAIAEFDGDNYSVSSTTFEPILNTPEAAAAWSDITEFNGSLDDEIILAVYVASTHNGLSVFTTEEYRDRSIFTEHERATLVRATVTVK